jgi:CheY-like chemotaxis protein
MALTDGSSVRATLAPHLPHLRRYARALTGSQPRGDAYVRHALETLLGTPEPPARAEPALDPRLVLFRLFSAVAQDAPVVGPQSLPRGSMQALLLTEVEGFSADEAAFILGTPLAAIADHVQQAKAAIAATIRARVLIIEDEPLIAMHLEQIVMDMGHDVVGMAMTHQDALACARATAPGLVLADIQLADGSSGLEAAREILEGLDIPVIFITAYPERLLTGERPEPTFLVTKPFRPESIVATIGQALLARSFSAEHAA